MPGCTSDMATDKQFDLNSIRTASHQRLSLHSEEQASAAHKKMAELASQAMQGFCPGLRQNITLSRAHASTKCTSSIQTHFSLSSSLSWNQEEGEKTCKRNRQLSFSAVFCLSLPLSLLHTDCGLGLCCRAFVLSKASPTATK